MTYPNFAVVLSNGGLSVMKMDFSPLMKERKPTRKAKRSMAAANGRFACDACD